jgi:glucose dehydrogenase
VPGATRLEAVPLVSNGVMYVSQPNEVYALDAGSGRKIWEYRFDLPSSGDQTGV